MSKSHLEREEHKSGTHDRSRSPSCDNPDSKILKLSGCGNISEDQIREFFNGIEIDVGKLFQLTEI